MQTLTYMPRVVKSNFPFELKIGTFMPNQVHDEKVNSIRLRSLEKVSRLSYILDRFNSQAPDLPCAAVGHFLRLSRPRFGCNPKTVKNTPLEV